MVEIKRKVLENKRTSQLYITIPTADFDKFKKGDTVSIRKVEENIKNGGNLK